MPKVFWAEVVNTANYILNMAYTRVLSNKTACEMWHEHKPSVSHMKTFGSVYCAKIPAEKRSTFDPKPVLAIFIGYSDLSRSYKLYNVKSEKVFINKDVKFDERLSWNWDNEIVENSGDVFLGVDEQLQGDNYELTNLEDENLAVKGTRSLEDIYNKCNLAMTDPTSFWIYRTKLNLDGSINKYKARLAVNESINWGGLENIPFGCQVSRSKWNLKEKIYIAQPEGYERIDDYFKGQGLNRSITEPTFYVKSSNESAELVVALYVDDLLITRPDTEYLQEFKAQMMSIFEITGLGLMSYFLKMEVQKNTPLTAGNKFSKNDGSAKADGSIYRSIVGSLLYLSATKPDIRYATCLLSRVIQTPSLVHFTAAKRILRYVKGMIVFGLLYLKKDSGELQGFSDNDWARSVDDSKSTGSFCFLLGSAVFTRASKKQEIVAQSSAEAEYIAIALAAIHTKWLRKDAIKDQEIELRYCQTDDQLADIFTIGLGKERFELLRAGLGIYQVPNQGGVLKG
ncbi:Uncharacterized protein TCM_029194 [Theobroma cacao]|uniref:Uncharacterized protein n=1 Tax=Theobroma cacao TaxID=3641 RepID=A0A061GDU3_THECC|nr:Uncharacterized protein TCM_029194 [Theobroma cacao]